MVLLKQDIKKTEPFWIRYIKTRIKKKKNFLCLVFGQTGSGKSWSCLSIALMLDENFNEKRIVFGLKGLMELINSGENFPAGTCFVWDEFQQEGGNRQWQSLSNRLINSLLSTFRHKNFILLINSPYSDFIDSQTRKLLHSEWECVGIDYKLQKTKIKPMITQYNSRTRKFYHKYLRVRTKTGVSPIKLWKISKPPKWIVDLYEKQKENFTTALNKDIEMQLNKEEGTKIDTRRALTQKQEEVLELMAKYSNTSKVAKEIGVTQRNINFHIAQALKKGYSARDFVEKGGKSE